MKDSLDLKAIERKAWRSTFSDGIWDIYLGWLLVVLGLMTYMNDLGLAMAVRYAVPMLLMVLGMIGMWLGKRYITMPRLGRVEFSEERKDRRGHVRLFLLGLVVLTVVLWLTFSRSLAGAAASPGAATWQPAVVWVVLVSAAFVFLANRYDYGRFYLIGLFYASTVPLDEALTALTGWDVSIVPFSGLGLLLMLMGAQRLWQFLQRYPDRSEAGAA